MEEVIVCNNNKNRVIIIIGVVLADILKWDDQ